MGFSVGGEIDETRLRDRIMDEAKKAFKPEFLNRLTDIVMFNSLSKESLQVIVDLELAKLQTRLKEQRIKLTVSDEAKAFLIEKGYDEKLGARPLRRAVEKYLEDNLAESLLAGSIKKGKAIKVLMHEDEESDANASITRSFSGGIAWVGRRAENCLVFRDGIATASIEACGYIRDMAVIDSDGTLFLGYDDDAGTTALLRLDPDGSLTDLEAPMYRLAWDDTTRVLYAVDDGATQVQALTSDGGPVFSLDFDDPVVDLAVLEREAKLAVLTVSGAEGLVHIFDQYTGEKLVDLDAGSSAHTLAASLDGDTMAWAQSDRLIISTVDWDELLAGEDTGD